MRLSLLFAFIDDDENKGNNNADENAGGNGEIKFEVSPVDNNITRQFPKKWHFRGEVNNRPCDNHDYSGNY
jgi:hypothetical protein